MTATAPATAGTKPQTVWQLFAPDWSALDTVWRNPLPFVLWPVGHQALLAHWMDEAVRRGVDTVELFVADRPTEVRAHLEGGAYWSRRVRIMPIACDADAPIEAQLMAGLPGDAHDAVPADGRELLQHWFELQKRWLARRCEDAVTLDTRHSSGGWIGAQARIHPTAKLVAPFWIGAHASVGAGCEIGPDAIIGAHAILDENVAVRQACVLSRTYLGCNTELAHAAATGGTLLDFQRGCRVDIAERFILGPVSADSRGASVIQRFAALVLYALLAPVTKLWCRAWNAQDVAAPDGSTIHLRAAAPGVFSLADVHGCHDPADPEEWIHAVYQAQRADPRVTATVLKRLWRIAWFKTANTRR